MFKSPELPDCYYYEDEPTLVSPQTQTPKHSLYLSNLDDQTFLRFSIKYIYLFKTSVSTHHLKLSLSRTLVDYYPLAGRLRSCDDDDRDRKLELDCNGEGAVFAEGFMDVTAQDFLGFSRHPNKSWRKLLYRVQSFSFLDVPPLVVQITHLKSGGMILCIAMNHCLCDGIGTSQFLNAWAHMTRKPNHDLPTSPFHARHVLKPRDPPSIRHSHNEYTRSSLKDDINQYLQSAPLVSSSIIFNPTLILHLKRRCVPSLKCTTFEALASHTWRSWIRSLDLPMSLSVKLLFSVNIRRKLNPELPKGYYGNGFALACAQSTVKELVHSNIYRGIKLVQEAKARLNDDYIRSMVDLLEDKTVKTDLRNSLVISQWAKLGLEDLDFGEGKPLHMGPLTSDIYCLFLPVAGNFDAVRVQVSLPENAVGKFEYYMKEFLDTEDNGLIACDGNKFII